MEYSRFSSPKKRRMADFEEDYNTVIQSPDIWLPDGDVIIQAQTVQFRVKLKDFTENFCKVFYDRFISGRKFNGPGTPPSVIYVPEKAQEWKDMLMCQYHDRMEWYPIDRPVSLLRLSDKYQFHSNRNRATYRLRNIIPCTDVFAWDYHDFSNTSGDRPKLSTSGYEFHLINAALEVGLQTIIPALYFICIRDLGSDRILGVERHPNGEHESLSPSIQRMLMSAAPMISQLSMEHTELTPRRLLQDAYASGEVICGEEDPYQTCASRSVEADQWLLRLAREPGLALRRISEERGTKCDTCNEFFRNKVFEGRLKIWEALPLIFGLPPWTEMIDYEDTCEELGVVP